MTALLNRIAGKTHKLLVLHGASGVGKSSLVNGGLLPALQARALDNRDNAPVLVRRYTDWLRELAVCLVDALANTRVETRYITALQTELESFNPNDGQSRIPLKGNKTPSFSPPFVGSAFSKSRGLGGSPATNGPDPTNTPINPPSPQTPPLLSHILAALRQCEACTLRPVLIFDQFEEFFFANSDPLARREFFQFLADCLELQPSALKIVLSLREDYLHYLLEAKQMVKRSPLTEGSMARSQLEDILGKQILYEIGNFSPADAKAIIQQLSAGVA